MLNAERGMFPLSVGRPRVAEDTTLINKRPDYTRHMSHVHQLSERVGRSTSVCGLQPNHTMREQTPTFFAHTLPAGARGV